MGGLTPRKIAQEWTLPQLAVLVLKAEEVGQPDPFKLRPGEYVRGKGRGKV